MVGDGLLASIFSELICSITSLIDLPLNFNVCVKESNNAMLVLVYLC